jgi:geranylgeranyl diphosphate synthase, type II
MKKKPEKSFDLPGYLAARRRIIDDKLESLLDKYSITSDLYHAMYYSLMNPGKRLRPILCIAAAEAVGAAATEQVMRAACAIEMIHTYSLIHDDLPSIDDDAMRRGKPTCHVKFNEATAILAGDALLTLAFEVLSDPAACPDDMSSANMGENMSRQLTLISKIAMAAGNRGMIEGQMLDMAAQGKPTDLKALKLMHNLKTGAIIEAAVAAGAISGGATDAQVEALSVYARSIGLAFQVTDDILNVEGDPEIMGKATGTDRLRKKATYPALIGLAESKKYAIELVSIALQSLAIFDNKAVPLFSIAQYIIERKR